MIGQTLGHYRIVEKIGEGGMGVVYLARDERLNRDVALKLLPEGMLKDVAALKSFREEAQALSKLNHPNIATIHDFDAQDNLNFLVMEYIHGVTLDRKIAAGPLSTRDVIRLGTQLAQGLQAAHGKGVIHRDLKPSNLGVTPDCRLKILDFGLARFSATADQNSTLTSLESAPEAGTLPYMAPEQLQGRDADERSDIYAAGAVLYEMTTGQRLFPEKHGVRLVDAILHRSPRLPRDLNTRISPELQDIIQKALDKDAERRYQSARELEVDLQRIPLSHNPTEPAADQEPTGPLPLEIAHVLYMDIVSYSKFPMDRQKRLLEELQKTVRGTAEYLRAKLKDRLISLPSGDGMALVFFTDPESACRCALEVSHLLRNHPDITLRMGIHTGPVYRMADINANRNVTGGGINLAQRVMDCGDARHILVSNTVADVLVQLSSWDGFLRDLGEAEVKHGTRIHIFNLCTDDAGNPALPKRLTERKRAHKSDSGKLERVRSKSGVRARNGSGFKKTSEIEADSTPGQSKDDQYRQPAPLRRPILKTLQTATRKRLRVLILTVLMLAILAFAVNLVPRNTKAAPPGVPPLTAGKYLAVLPFTIEGDATNLQPFAEGLNQQLSAKLLNTRDLSVASARATEDIDPHAALATIGSSSGSNLVVRGSLQGDDKTIQVNVTLEEVTSGKRRLKQSFPGTRKDLLKLEDQIYLRILQVLDLDVPVEELTRPGPTENPEAYELYTRGRSIYRGHPDLDQIKTVLGLYEKAIRIDPNFALAHASLADASLRMYRETREVSWIDKATTAAEQARKLDDHLPEAYLALGNIYRTTGRTDEAIKKFIHASQLSPSDDCYRRLGLAYLGAGKKFEAIIAFQNAVALNPFYWSNHVELGNALLQFGDYSRAIPEFRTAIELDPTNPIGHQNLGAVYFSQGFYEESIPEFNRAVELRSTDAETYSDLGEALLYLQRYEEALQNLEKSAQIQPNNQLIIGNLADGYRWAKQQKKSDETYDRAIALANKDIAVNPRDTTALGSLATYHAKKGNIDLAEHYIRRARSIDASDVELIYSEAVIRSLSDQSELALESLRLAFEKGVPPDRANLDPDLSSLHDNPGFKKLVKAFLDKPKRRN
jgi:serine/threonine protein kinase/tetratricopeptide (TPR) repeat protein